MENTIKVSYETVCENGYVALIIEPFLDEKVTGNFLDLTFDCVGFFKEVGFKQIERISVPVSSQVKSHRDVGYGKRKKILLDLNRDLVVFRR